MRRFHGWAGLTAALVCAGLVRADATTSAKQSAAKDSIITLTTSDGKPQRCQVLKTYKHSSGAMALEVKDLDTGEVMTIVESAAPATAKQADASAKPTTIAQMAAQSTAGKPTDPIMQPKDYVANKKVQKELEGENKSPKAGASTRWSGKPAERKPAVAVVTVPAVEAARHPDPVFRMIGCLRDDLLPSMREVAAETLASGPGRTRPEVIAALAEAAEKDPAASVRACCLRCLTAMSSASPECMAALQKLNVAGDAGIRSAGGVPLNLK